MHRTIKLHLTSAQIQYLTMEGERVRHRSPPKTLPVLALLSQKTKLEEELRSCNQILIDNNVNMSSPLVDSQGFPRADIDVYQVRNARHKIICLKNDLRTVFDKIKAGIEEIHAKNAELAKSNTQKMVNQTPREATGPHADNVPLKPFAVVTVVEIGSPAHMAGLCRKDRIIQFGSITNKNFSGMEGIYNIVSHSMGHPINVQVRRGSLVVALSLVPKPWNNRGVLGCEIQKEE